MKINSNFIPLTLAFIILIAGVIYLSADLATGEKLSYDEFYTLERSNGFQKHRDWLSVYSGNLPSEKKPPLQYWISAVGLELGLSDLLSLRFPSYIFFFGLIISSALINYLLSEKNPWVIPATFLLMGCSLQLVKFGRSGMLDVGMSFFTMISLLMFFYAKQNTRYWVFCGLFCGLGAMQKAPVAMLYIAIAFYVLSRSDVQYKLNHLKSNNNFKIGFLLSFIFILIWHFIQSFRYGDIFAKEAVWREMVKRFLPFGYERIAQANFLNWLGWLWDDLHIIGVISIICTVLVLFGKRFIKDNRLYALSVIILFVAIALSLGTGALYPRYLLVLTPLLVCVAVTVLNKFIYWKPGIFVISVIFFGVYINDINNTVESISGANGQKYSKIHAYVDLIEGFRKSEDYLVFDKSILPSGAYGYFGKDVNLYSGFWLSKEERLKYFLVFLERKRAGGLIGFTRNVHKTAIEKVLGSIDVLKSVDGFIIWRYVPSLH